MRYTDKFIRAVRALLALGSRGLAHFRRVDAQLWEIAKTDSPDAPKTSHQPPKIRCC